LIIPSSPVFAYIEVTSSCNNNCFGCGTVFSIDDDQASINIEVWQSILPKLKPSVVHLNLTGGEPTLSPNFVDLLSLINKLDFSFSLFTNARWHDKKKFAGSLGAASKLSEILISLHGPDAESHDGFTGISGSFIETCNNIRFAVDHNLPVFVNCIITSLNFDRIAEIVQINRKLGLQGIIFSRFVHSKESHLNPSDNQLKAAIQTIIDQKKASDIPIYSSVCIPKCFHNSNLFNGCLAGTITLTIDPWGNVRPCVMSASNCGNLLEDSLRVIWHSQEMQKWRSFIPSFCDRCSAYTSCHGGCRAAAMINGLQQDPLIRDPLPEDHSHKRIDIELPEDAIPVKCFKMRPETFGYILIQKSQVIPVAREAKDILDLCNGHTKMQAIHNRFGQDGIDLVAKLYYQGMIKFR
jgi:radical SAM protein with 4Fe4S-binding SPASM domain